MHFGFNIDVKLVLHGMSSLALGCICSQMNNNFKIINISQKILIFCVDVLLSVTSEIGNFHVKPDSSALLVKKQN